MKSTTRQIKKSSKTELVELSHILKVLKEGHSPWVTRLKVGALKVYLQAELDGSFREKRSQSAILEYFHVQGWVHVQDSRMNLLRIRLRCCIKLNLSWGKTLLHI